MWIRECRSTDRANGGAIVIPQERSECRDLPSVGAASHGAQTVDPDTRSLTARYAGTRLLRDDKRPYACAAQAGSPLLYVVHGSNRPGDSWYRIAFVMPISDVK